jgi:hypothetical protein
MPQRGMEEAPENGKESSHSAHANGMNECLQESFCMCKTRLNNSQSIIIIFSLFPVH